MNETQQRVHRWVWPILAVALLAFLVAAVALRPPATDLLGGSGTRQP
ncbi:MAG: hypothetical protein KF902_08210 [Phycisphaeraceae bacterium]|nr:hypothetical protein [Phycisphaeraceae bacterium]